MAKSISALKEKRSLILSFGSVIICLICFWVLEKNLGAQVLDMLPHYDLDAVKTYFVAYGDEGRSCYGWAILTLDILFPIAYVAFLVGVISLLSDSTGWFSWLITLPIMLGTIDLFENVQIFLMLNQYPQITETQVNLASNTTAIKHHMSGVIFVCMIVLSMSKLAIEGIKTDRNGEAAARGIFWNRDN